MTHGKPEMKRLASPRVGAGIPPFPVHGTDSSLKGLASQHRTNKQECGRVNFEGCTNNGVTN